MASVDLTIKFRKKKLKKNEKSFLINKKNNTGLASLQLVFTKQGYNMYIERTAITESTTINSPTLLTSRLGRSLCRSIYVYLRKLRLRLFFFFGFMYALSTYNSVLTPGCKTSILQVFPKLHLAFLSDDKFRKHNFLLLNCCYSQLIGPINKKISRRH